MQQEGKPVQQYVIKTGFKQKREREKNVANMQTSLRWVFYMFVSQSQRNEEKRTLYKHMPKL